MPTPLNDETEDEFISRCMADEESNATFPDNEQRLAFCYSVWNREDKEMKMEKKLISFSECHIKSAEDGVFEGYASVFNGVDSYKDTIIPGAYKKTLENRSREIYMYFNHSSFRPDMPAKIGKWVDAQEDDKGLYMKGVLTLGHPTADAIYASLKAGTVDGLSIGYQIPKGGAETKDGVRYLKEIDLYEVSVVDHPADDAARISLDSVKNSIENIKSIRDAEDFLRDVANLSGSSAKTLLAQLKGVLREDVRQEVEKAEFVNRLNSIFKG
jgi:HK97 family phage prohead protease